MKYALAVMTSVVLSFVWVTTAVADEVRSGNEKSKQSAGHVAGPVVSQSRQNAAGTTPKASKGARASSHRRSGLNRRGAMGRRARAGARRSVSVNGRNRPMGKKGNPARAAKHPTGVTRAIGKSNARSTGVVRRVARTGSIAGTTSPPADQSSTAPKPNPATPPVAQSPPTVPPAATIPASKRRQHQPQPIQPKVKAIQSRPMEPAPPLDEWEKYVANVSEHYGFTDDQNGGAQSILDDLRNRARRYRLSRGPEFEQAERIEDRKARADRLKQLNQRIDQLFNELKMRLENLPTIEQKLRADQPEPKTRLSRRQRR